ncbi:hypothetical protein BD414DRAFT_45672 [Trametes punicea]|nr:hypothetical protein BD414DRAFT_45672 [Trametes punicea]
METRAQEDGARPSGHGQEVRRMPSEGTVLSGQSQAGSGVSLGRHGTRIEGDRVLLPARKVTRRRADSEAAAAARREEVRSAESAEKTEEEPSRAEARRKEEKEEMQVRVVGERVLLPARKVTTKGTDGEGSKEESATASTSSHSRPTLERSRNDSEGAPSPLASSSSKDTTIPGRAQQIETQNTIDDAPRLEARTKPPESLPVTTRPASSSSPQAVAFPSTSSAVPSAVSDVPGVSASGRGAGVVVVVDPEGGGEDRFSKPKRARMDTLAVSSNNGSTSSSARANDVQAPSMIVDPSSSSSSSQPGRIDRAKASSAGATSAGERNGVSATASAAAAATPKPQQDEGRVTSSQPSSMGSGTAPASGRPPRRRKYSLLAAFGLPVGRTAPDPDCGASTDARGSAPEVARQAKPPTPPAALSGPPAGSERATRSRTAPAGEHACEEEGQPRSGEEGSREVSRGRRAGGRGVLFASLGRKRDR